ncbi:MAG: NF038122 family metalloprotease, partial [Cyanobacteria bacterium P01_A01_bin.37]
MAQFNFQYHSSIPLDQMIGFEMAGRIWSHYLTDDVTINIDVYGSDALPDNVLGGAIPTFHQQHYGLFNQYLASDITSADDALAYSSIQQGNTADLAYSGDIVEGNTELLLTSANAKALGMDEAITLDRYILENPDASDGAILIRDDAAWSYDYLRDGEVSETSIDFLSVALHEIGHILGFVSSVDYSLFVQQLHSGATHLTNFTPLDLFRYSPEQDVTDVSTGGTAFFSIDGGQTNEAYFATGSNTTLGGDGYQASHWQQTDNAVGILDPTLAYGEQSDITGLDLKAFDVIGWDIKEDALNTPLNWETLLLESKIIVAEELDVSVDWLEQNTSVPTSNLSAVAFPDFDEALERRKKKKKKGKKDALFQEVWEDIFSSNADADNPEDTTNQVLREMVSHKTIDSYLEDEYGVAIAENQDQIITGTDENDSLDGGDGDDLIDGDKGNDLISGGLGADLIWGQDGNDRLFGGDGDDLLFGETDEDELNGQAGADILWGDDGNDILDGGDGRDFLNGGTEADVLAGGSSDDVLEGGSGDDILVGDTGQDALAGGNGNDILYGDGYENQAIPLTLQQLRDLRESLTQANDLPLAEEQSASSLNKTLDGGQLPFRVDATTLTLGGGFTVETHEISGISGDRVISLRNGHDDTGTASLTFSKASGLYNIVVGYLDENDGQAEVTVRLNGVEIDEWDFDADNHALNTRTVAVGVSLNPGDVIEIEGTRRGEEYARISYLEFTPILNTVIEPTADTGSDTNLGGGQSGEPNADDAEPSADNTEPIADNLVSDPVITDDASNRTLDNGDLLRGGGGNDELYGGNGNDVLYGEDEWNDAVVNESSVHFYGNDAIIADHTNELLVNNGTLSFSFQADEVSTTQGLFSKDSEYYDDGGHLTVYLESGKLVARLQSKSTTHYVSTTVNDGQDYDVAVTFGSRGFELWLNGTRVDTNSYTGGLGTNSGGIGNYEPIVLGASQVQSGNQVADVLQNDFTGMLKDVQLFDQQLDDADISRLSTHIPSGINAVFEELITTPSDAGNDVLVGGNGNDRLYGNAGDDILYGDDPIMISSERTFDGFDGNNVIVTNHTSDMLLNSGTLSFNFQAASVSETQGLFSKDSSYYDDGGHLTVYLEQGNLVGRLQSSNNSYHVQASVTAGQDYDVALTFGTRGLELWLNGSRVDTNSYTGGLGKNSGGIGNYEPIVLGASQSGSGNQIADSLQHYFTGTLKDVRLFDQQLDGANISQLSTQVPLNANAVFEELIDPAFHEPLTTGNDNLYGDGVDLLNEDNTVLSSFRLPNGAIVRNGKAYLITESSQTWEEAQAEAQTYGGNLVAINDEAEQDWLSQT